VWLEKLIQKGLGYVMTGVQGFTSWWEGIWGSIMNFFRDIWTKTIDWILDFLGIHSPSRLFIEIATNLVDGLVNGLKAGWNSVMNFFKTAWQWVKDTALDVIDSVTGFFGGLWGKVTGAIGDLAGRVKTFFSSAWGKIQEALITAWTTVSTWLGGLGQRTIDAIGDMGSKLLSVGEDLIKGLIQGIKNMAGGVVDAIKNYVIDKIPGPIKQFFGINSPSRMFMEFGSFLMQGLAIGIEDEAETVMRALRVVMGDVAGVQFKTPSVSLGVSAGSYSPDTAGSGNTLIYNAAPGSSLGSQEDLFGAMGRARAFGW